MNFHRAAEKDFLCFGKLGMRGFLFKLFPLVPSLSKESERVGQQIYCYLTSIISGLLRRGCGCSIGPPESLKTIGSPICQRYS